MREISRYEEDGRAAVVKSDGGSYVFELYVKDQLVETKVFDEHTLRIVENYGKIRIKEYE